MGQSGILMGTLIWYFNGPIWYFMSECQKENFPTKQPNVLSENPADVYSCILTLVLLNPDIPCFTNSVDPDQLASEEAN